MGNRLESIEALIKKSEEAIKKIEQEYRNSLTKKSVDINLRIDIKNYCENLRSVLDYLAREIRGRYCPKANSRNKLYFPIFADLKSFQPEMTKAFPELQNNNNDIYVYLESIQPYQKEGNKWISYFNQLNNENKHEDLVEQVKQEVASNITVNTQGGGKVSWNPSSVKFGQGVYIGGVPVNPQTQMPHPHPSQKIEITTWVDFRFKGIDVSALRLLKESLKGIKDIFETMKKWIII